MFAFYSTFALCYLDGGHKSSCDVRAEAERHGELGDIFFLLHRCGDALLAEQLQVGDAVLHSHQVERRATRQEQTRVPVTPAQRGDRPLQGNRLVNGYFMLVYFLSTRFTKEAQLTFCSS